MASAAAWRRRNINGAWRRRVARQAPSFPALHRHARAMKRRRTSSKTLVMTSKGVFEGDQMVIDSKASGSVWRHGEKGYQQRTDAASAGRRTLANGENQRISKHHQPKKRGRSGETRRKIMATAWHVSGQHLAAAGRSKPGKISAWRARYQASAAAAALKNSKRDEKVKNIAPATQQRHQRSKVGSVSAK